MRIDRFFLPCLCMSRRARFTCWFSIGSVDSFEQKLDDIQDELDINPRDNVRVRV